MLTNIKGSEIKVNREFEKNWREDGVMKTFE